MSIPFSLFLHQKKKRINFVLTTLNKNKNSKCLCLLLFMDSYDQREIYFPFMYPHIYISGK